MIYLMYFLMFFGISRCQELVPTRFEIESSINRTIQEVERLIREDKSLPNLSRSQIVDILHNITSNDMNSYEMSVEKARSEYQRALTVVLPYNSKNSHGDDLKDLFTKPPLVQIIPDSGTMLPFSSIQEEPLPTSAEDNSISRPNSGEERQEYKNHRNIYSDVQTEKTPERFSFNLENFRTSTADPLTGRSRLEIIYSTSVTDKPKTTTAEIENTTLQQNNDEFRPTMPTTMSTSNLLSSDQWTYYAPPVTTTSTTTQRPITTTTQFFTSSQSTHSRRTNEVHGKPKPFLPTVVSKITEDVIHEPSVNPPETSSKKPQTVTFESNNYYSKELLETTSKKPQTVTFISNSYAPKKRIETTPKGTQVVSSLTHNHHLKKLIETTPKEPQVVNVNTNIRHSEKPIETSSEKPQTVTFVSNNYAPKKLIEPTPKEPQVINVNTNIRHLEKLIETSSKKPQTVTFVSNAPKKLIEPTPKEPQVININTHIRHLEKLIETNSKKPQTVTFGMYNDEMMINEPTAAMYVTPMATSTSTKIPSSTSGASKMPSSPKKEVAGLLAAIGLRPTVEDSFTEIPSNSPSQEMIFGTDFTIPESNNIFPSHNTAALSTGVDSPTIISQNSFNYFPSNLQSGMNNLTPDVQLLFQRFGLPSSGKVNELSTSTTIKTPIVRPTSSKNSWSMFKPLPTTEIKDKGMKEFLSQFGLGVVENRSQKAMKNKKSSPNNVPSIIEAVPNNMKNILENIGLITRTTTSGKVKLSTTTEASAKLHVFKPHESLFNDEMQRSKINELLDTVKLVQEGKAGVTDVRKVANELLKNTNTLSDGPDPLSLEEILKIYNEDLKNEVKRQQSEDEINSTDMATSETTLDSVSVSSNTTVNSNSSMIMKNTTDSSSDATGTSVITMNSEDSSSDATGKSVTTSKPALPTQGPNIDDLVDSFGGSTAKPDPVLPTPRKSGLYFLVDWNTFLEVGEEDKDKVNLRFAPKVGDRTRFIPVVVP